MGREEKVSFSFNFFCTLGRISLYNEQYITCVLTELK